MADATNAPSKQTWKAVLGYEGRYEVSDWGNVRSLLHRKRGPVLLRPSTDAKGYRRVSLQGNTRKVHHLVLEAFARLRGGSEECAHLDGDATNNSLPNLAWKTSAENKADQVRHGTARVGERHLHAKLSNEDVRRIRRQRRAGKMWKDIHAQYPHVTLHGLIQAGVGATHIHLDSPPADRRMRKRPDQSAAAAPGR